MERTLKFSFIFLSASIVLLAACKKDVFEEPDGLKITFMTTTQLVNISDSVQIEEANMGIGDIDFKLAGSADSSSVEKIVYQGPYLADLIKKTVSPEIKWIFADPGMYRSIVITTRNILPGGNSIIVKGTIKKNGSVIVPFEIVTRKESVFNIENLSGIEVKENETLELVVVFDLSNLFNGMDISSLNTDDDGVLRITDDGNIKTFNLILERFEALSSFGIKGEQNSVKEPDKVPVLEETGSEGDKEDENETGQEEDAGSGQTDNNTGNEESQEGNDNQEEEVDNPQDEAVNQPDNSDEPDSDQETDVGNSGGVNNDDNEDNEENEEPSQTDDDQNENRDEPEEQPVNRDEDDDDNVEDEKMDGDDEDDVENEEMDEEDDENIDEDNEDAKDEENESGGDDKSKGKGKPDDKGKGNEKGNGKGKGKGNS